MCNIRWIWYVGLAFAAGIVATVAMPAAVQSILAVSQCVAWVLGVRFLLAHGATAIRGESARQTDTHSGASRSASAWG